MTKEDRSAGSKQLSRRTSSRTMGTSGQLNDSLLPTSRSTEREIQPLLPRDATSSGNASAVGGVSAVTNPWASLVNNLYSGASNLANLLPTGTFLAFTAIAPIITDNGTCDDPFELYLTISTLVCFALFCLLSCFTDSYQAADGQVYYGIVTFKGLWTPQLPEVLHPGDKEQYKVTIIDLVHAILSVIVFAACALMTPNIRACLYPNIPENIIRIVPAFVGFLVSALFVALPTKRHGIGFPVSPASYSFASREMAFQQKRDQQVEASASWRHDTSSPTLSKNSKK